MPKPNSSKCARAKRAYRTRARYEALTPVKQTERWGQSSLGKVRIMQSEYAFSDGWDCSDKEAKLIPRFLSSASWPWIWQILNLFLLQRLSRSWRIHLPQGIDVVVTVRWMKHWDAPFWGAATSPCKDLFTQFGLPSPPCHQIFQCCPFTVIPVVVLDEALDLHGCMVLVQGSLNSLSTLLCSRHPGTPGMPHIWT